jgi:hypothetical protein
MPPWHANPKYGKFSNDRSLSEAEMRTIVEWVNGGAPEGDPKLRPAPPVFTSTWTIGEPDLIIEAKPYQVPAEGVIDLQIFDVPTHFTEDVWVTGIEVLPTNRAVVHHERVNVIEAEDLGKHAVDSAHSLGSVCPEARARNFKPQKGGGWLLANYVPGNVPLVAPEGAAWRIGHFDAGVHGALQRHRETGDRSSARRFRVCAKADHQAG